MITGEHFKAHELCCKHCGAQGVTQELVDKLDELRERMNMPLVLTSAYRCPNHPIEAKKKRPGYHSKGIAADVAVTGGDQIKLISIAYELGFKGFGIADSFVHIDLRKTLTKWSY